MYQRAEQDAYTGKRKTGGRAGRSGNVRARRRRARRRQRIRRILCAAAALLLLGIGLKGVGKDLFSKGNLSGGDESRKARQLLKEQEAGSSSVYPKELLDMLEKNEETYDFVSGYPKRADYQGREISLEQDFEPGEVPLLMQWDMRWGYDRYGEDLIAVAGCGPTCMTMAYLYLTEDTSMNPRKMSEFANEQGFYTEAGTSWNFFTDGAAALGLSGQEIGLDENRIKSALDQGSVVICSMGPGDFTTTGHFVVLRGYDENGFFVNDPNRRKNSEKQWSFETLSPQIKCLWEITK